MNTSNILKQIDKDLNLDEYSHGLSIFCSNVLRSAMQGQLTKDKALDLFNNNQNRLNALLVLVLNAIDNFNECKHEDYLLAHSGLSTFL